MPTLGGLAIFFSFMLGYILYANQSLQMLSILMGSFLLVIFGMVDCINPVKAKYRLLVQLVAASIIVFYGNIVLNDVTLLGIIVFLHPVTNSLVEVLIIALLPTLVMYTIVSTIYLYDTAVL